MGKFDSYMDWINLAQNVGAGDSYKISDCLMHFIYRLFSCIV